MPVPSDSVRRGGRRGRRTAAMLRIARERIAVLFALAEEEAGTGRLELSDRYVTLARRIGTRYNVRLMPEYRELYCRGCSRFWVEGRTVRTRIRSGRRIRTCLGCGRVRRVPVRSRSSPAPSPPVAFERPAPDAEPVPVDLDADDLGDAGGLGDEAEEE